MPIENVSDTARWVAYYRALETERPDALFRDPYARALAGARGAAIAAALPGGRAAAWSLIVRTRFTPSPRPSDFTAGCCGPTQGRSSTLMARRSSIAR